MNWAFVYVTDERGLELAKHSAMSVALSQNEPCDIHIFCYQFSPRPSPDFTAALARLRSNLIVHTISDLAMEQHETWGHVTTPTLLKPAAVSELVGSYDRIVYLDNDIIVFDDLQVATIDFGSAPVAAVIDMDLSRTGALRDSVWAYAGGKTPGLGGYFNAGVLIFESRNWRDSDFRQKYTAALNQHDIACSYKLDCTSIDQCALNSVFENNWIKLPLSYNLQASAKFTAAWQTAAVRHYCGWRKVIPVGLFRNDSRDVRYLNKIKQALGRPTARLPLLYEIPFGLNVARNYSSSQVMRRFMHAYNAERMSTRQRRESSEAR
jgi:lipopolysaccharide biosynthesis glycosyltransferase